jgi:hypothetical protein
MSGKELHDQQNALLPLAALYKRNEGLQITITRKRAASSSLTEAQ